MPDVQENRGRVPPVNEWNLCVGLERDLITNIRIPLCRAASKNCFSVAVDSGRVIHWHVQIKACKL